MSGIAGILSLDQAPVNPDLLQAMLSRIAHRGAHEPRMSGRGEARLGICQSDFLPCKTNPIDAHDAAIVCVADARLDDRDSLRLALGMQAGEWDEIEDSQAIALAYQKWGEACVDNLQGDFAFALWDAAAHRLFCARDRMGVRPFYYHLSSKVFLFASEPKALLAHPDVGREFDELRIARYLAAEFEEKESTFFRQIRRLPPGEVLVVEDGKMRRRTYWQVQANISTKAEYELVDEFRHLLQQSVKDRLRSARPVSFLVSGGLDSSSILMLAQKHLSQAPDCYLATFPDFPAIDESRYVDRLSAYASMKKHPVRVDNLGPVSMLETIYRHIDQPFHFPNLYVFWALAQEAQRQGSGVMLDGMDGDTTVSHGMEILPDLLRRGRWVALLRTCRQLSRQFGQPSHKFFLHFSIGPLASPLMTPISSRLSSRSMTQVLNRDFAKRIDSAGLKAQVGHEKRRNLDPAMVHLGQINSGIIPYHLEMHDQAAAAFSLDHRHPYYDSRLVEFCLSVPPEMKLREGLDRWIQRRALQNIVPDEFRLRIPKSNWSDNFERSLLRTDSKIIRQFLSEPGALNKFVDVSYVQGLYSRLQSTGRLRTGDGMRIWTSVSLGVWLRNCLKGD